MMLTQQEANKVKERDEQHTVELREWRGEIATRKQVSQAKLLLCSIAMNAMTAETGGGV